MVSQCLGDPESHLEIGQVDWSQGRVSHTIKYHLWAIEDLAAQPVARTPASIPSSSSSLLPLSHHLWITLPAQALASCSFSWKTVPANLYFSALPPLWLPESIPQDAQTLWSHGDPGLKSRILTVCWNNQRTSFRFWRDMMPNAQHRGISQGKLTDIMVIFYWHYWAGCCTSFLSGDYIGPVTIDSFWHNSSIIFPLTLWMAKALKPLSQQLTSSFLLPMNMLQGINS